jgi:hypothetical protein
MSVLRRLRTGEMDEDRGKDMSDGLEGRLRQTDPPVHAKGVAAVRQRFYNRTSATSYG